MRKELCCACVEELTGVPCEGHILAGTEGTREINIMLVTEDQISEVWRRLSCKFNGLCTPKCLEEQNVFGCCVLCGEEAVSCPDRCTGWPK